MKESVLLPVQLRAEPLLVLALCPRCRNPCIYARCRREIRCQSIHQDFPSSNFGYLGLGEQGLSLAMDRAPFKSCQPSRNLRVSRSLVSLDRRRGSFLRLVTQLCKN
ncbi:hypothetical protein LB505_002679 [Fusarium chuoi]|nr:hypothetical protein LB505_002679 [Fusarium chuoi]